MLSSTLFLLLSALVVPFSYAAPSAPGPSEGVVDAGASPNVPQVNSYAGAPVDGAYPADVQDMGGWESDAPTYDTAVGPLLPLPRWGWT
jgi:hypothetical protein